MFQTACAAGSSKNTDEIHPLLKKDKSSNRRVRRFRLKIALLSFQSGRAEWIGTVIQTCCDLGYGLAVLVHFQLRNGERGGFV